MNKTLIILAATLLTITQSFNLSAEPPQSQPPSLSINCAPQLQKSLHTIHKIPEARKLIAQVYREAPFSIDVRNTTLSNQFGAFWDQMDRVICVGISPKTNEGEIIGSILFELHNAAVSSEFDRLDALAASRQISKERYVEAVEYLEYLNSLKASAIAKKGIEQGIFPPTAHLHTYRNFDEHFYYQKMGGHSAWIGQTYDQLAG